MKSLLAIVCLVFGLSHSGAASAAEGCKSLDASTESHFDFQGLRVVRENSTLDAAEGVTNVFFYEQSDLRYIVISAFGETGKTQMLVKVNPRYYFVIFSDYFYTAPVYAPGGSVASINTSKFFICDGALVRGIDDQVIQPHVARARELLKRAVALGKVQ